jgi:hypothetical protein
MTPCRIHTLWKLKDYKTQRALEILRHYQNQLTKKLYISKHLTLSLLEKLKNLSLMLCHWTK